MKFLRVKSPRTQRIYWLNPNRITTIRTLPEGDAKAGYTHELTYHTGRGAALAFATAGDLAAAEVDLSVPRPREFPDGA